MGRREGRSCLKMGQAQYLIVRGRALNCAAALSERKQRNNLVPVTHTLGVGRKRRTKALNGYVLLAALGYGRRNALPKWQQMAPEAIQIAGPVAAFLPDAGCLGRQ